jgi:uncharacterized phage protein gp47/JayE
MTTYGLTDDGFVPKTTEIARDSMNTRLREQFGASLDLSDQDPLGFVVGLVAAELGECWEVTEDVNAAQTREGATGAALDDIGLLTGTFRPEARPSEVTLTLTGTPTTNVPANRQAETASTGVVFETQAAAVIAATTAWVPTTAYVVGNRRTNASRVYLCITAGTSAGSGGPTTTAADITDNTVHWRYLGEGTGNVDVEALCTVDGPSVALSGDITVIVTPVGGWSSVINILDAVEGANEAEDEEYRLLQEIDLAAAGSSSVDAIREALLEIAGVTAVKLFVNNEDATDPDGVPPHAIEALVRGGANQDIWNALLENVAAGVETYGSVIGTATDSEGNDHEMAFSRPTDVNIYVDVTLIKDPDTYPVDGDTQVKAAVVAYGDLQDVGRDVVASRISAAVFDVTGVLDVTNIDIDTAPAPPTGVTIVITSRQLAVHDTSRITVATSDGTP